MNLEDMLSEISQTQKNKYYMTSLTCGIELIETAEWWLPRAWGGGNGEMLVKGSKLSDVS